MVWFQMKRYFILYNPLKQQPQILDIPHRESFRGDWLSSQYTFWLNMTRSFQVGIFILSKEVGYLF